MRDIRQTPQYAKYLKKIGWIIETRHASNYFIKRFPLIGSVIKIQRPQSLRLDDIKLISLKHRSFLIIVEPKNDLDKKYLASMGYKLTHSPYLPTTTLQLDLNMPSDKILRYFKKDARQAINKTGNLSIKEESDLENFAKKWKRAVGLTRSIPSFKNLLALKKSFGKNSIFLLTEDGSAGAIFLMGDKIGCYYWAFTSKTGRKQLAQYKIVWEGILWSKRQGAKVFDFEGIYDKRFPNKKWIGFTHFKKSFGGYEVEYPGCFVKHRIPL